ncbi:glycosyltransferase family 2 protein [Nocardioides sp. GCM10027113]|uniref:glycosyltransferase family 2 protein n=1 Tax=unclassified Nocardioides TaxID=2615069 RepID=UPI00361F44D8
MTARPGAPLDPSPRLDRTKFRYSIVIPVYNSEQIVGTTVDRVVEVFTEAGLDHEVILVNDGSPDGSWEVIAEKARTHQTVVALDLLRNYGQHHANLAGLRESTGDFVITMDDDLQNPPDQALLLIDAAMDGKDVVFGKFERKQAAGYRRLGSKMIDLINRRIFGQPQDLAVSNFRILRRDVVDRICASRTAHPYLTGQALLYSRHRGNVTVRHEPRPVGKSNYSMLRIVRLVLTILFSYSSFPLRLAALMGFALSGLAFLLGGVYLLMGIFGDTRVEGWTTLVVLLAVFSGFTMALLSMLGEYVVRTLNAVSSEDSYHVLTRVPQ